MDKEQFWKGWLPQLAFQLWVKRNTRDNLGYLSLRKSINDSCETHNYGLVFLFLFNQKRLFQHQRNSFKIVDANEQENETSIIGKFIFNCVPEDKKRIEKAIVSWTTDSVEPEWKGNTLQFVTDYDWVAHNSFKWRKQITLILHCLTEKAGYQSIKGTIVLFNTLYMTFEIKQQPNQKYNTTIEICRSVEGEVKTKKRYEYLNQTIN